MSSHDFTIFDRGLARTHVTHGMRDRMAPDWEARHRPGSVGAATSQLIGDHHGNSPLKDHNA
jgi:hypothetical protein